MSAPTLWIVLPLGLSGLLLLLRSQRVINLIACIFLILLTIAAWLLPIDTVLSIGGWSFKLSPSLQILGRSLTLTSANRSFLVLIYGSTCFWFIPAASLQVAHRLVPLGLAVTALLVAALAVVPFLYAALFIEVAVLLSIPLLATPGQHPGRGLIRFLIFQTLAMPFILFSGWLLAGIEANPGNLDLVKQAAVLLGLGFTFLLAIFPFNTWVPMLTEEAHPYAAGFVLWVLTTATLFFGLGFIDNYTWLRDSPLLITGLTYAGLLMIVSGGIFSAFQEHLGRILGYAVIVEIGFSLIAISLGIKNGLNMFLLLFVPRTLSLAVWALALSILRQHQNSLKFEDIKGSIAKLPFAASMIALSSLALIGVPLLAGFPIHNSIWEELAQSSLPLAAWAAVGSIGLVISIIRGLAALTAAPEGMNLESRETNAQRFLLSAGFLALVLFGLFPQWILPLWTKLPAIFEHLVH